MIQSLMQRFTYFLFEDLIKASYTAAAVNGVLLVPRIPQIIEPEERALLCFKGRDIFMDYNICTLHFIIMPQVDSMPHIINSYDEEDQDGQGRRQRRRQRPQSIRNRSTQLINTHYCRRDVS